MFTYKDDINNKNEINKGDHFLNSEKKAINYRRNKATT